MKTVICSVGLGCLAMLSLACGAKGDESPAPSQTGTAGTLGTGAAGSLTGSGAGGESSGAAGATVGAGGDMGGSGGSGGAGGSGPMVTKSYSFDTDVEGWQVQFAGATAPSMPFDKATVMLSHNATDGEPTPGSLELSIPFTSAGQNIDVGVDPTGVDLRGKTLTARIKIVSGFEDPMDLTMAPAIARLYAKSGAGYIYANGQFNNLTAVGTWIPITFPIAMTDFVAMSDAGTWDPSDIREIGVQLETSGTTTTASTAVVRIDTVTY